METPTLVTLANVVLTPVIVLFTMWVKAGIDKEKRSDGRMDGYIAKLEERIDAMDKEIKVIRIELKNRDAEYILLYKEHTTLKAKYEVLNTDHAELKKLYEATARELGDLKSDIRTKAEAAAAEMQKI